MIGRSVGSGYCTCVACGTPDKRSERRRLKRAERQIWKRAVGPSPLGRSEKTQASGA